MRSRIAPLIWIGVCIAFALSGCHYSQTRRPISFRMPPKIGWYVIVFDSNGEDSAAPEIVADFAASGDQIILVDTAFQPGHAFDSYVLVRDGKELSLDSLRWRMFAERVGFFEQDGRSFYFTAGYLGPNAPSADLNLEDVRQFCRDNKSKMRAPR